jgi:hypothetical protein
MRGFGGVSVEEEVYGAVVRRGAEHCVADADGEFILGNIFDLRDKAVCEGFELIVPAGEIAGIDFAGNDQHFGYVGAYVAGFS